MRKPEITPAEFQVMMRMDAPEGSLRLSYLCARKGQSRRVQILQAGVSGRVYDVTAKVASALGLRMSKDFRIIVTGHGFSASQHVHQRIEHRLGEPVIQDNI